MAGGLITREMKMTKNSACGFITVYCEFSLRCLITVFIMAPHSGLLWILIRFPRYVPLGGGLFLVYGISRSCCHSGAEPTIRFEGEERGNKASLGKTPPKNILSSQHPLTFSHRQFLMQDLIHMYWAPLPMSLPTQFTYRVQLYILYHSLYSFP